MDIKALKKNSKYFIVGFCREYRKSDRMGVLLADVGFCPIIAKEDFHALEKEIFEKCHRFDTSEFISGKQKHIKF